VAKALREGCGPEIACISQDLLRRTILKEKDRPGGVNIGLIDQVTRYCLDHGYHAIVDGILYADRYEQPHDADRDALALELGDVLCYSPRDVPGVLGGEGDHR